ncbi:prepilin-type N-terminal cleavage/methylation domain-containing protein [Clostridium butyricum]|uniref:Pilin n=1 Tax=Clostridium butyricum E4 str. BoNT E BL5262 TaxID=632245 RepID=C4IH40_CLOBU|nr:prepilin-type N-terminal cleavage/methylation domain-containing protein [Clostridium butyricum]APF25062.1 hypothetical protein NPD4_1198 [Clostridium butyricum]EDT75036.1 pilin [Clostridium butyricum 5521]EEP53603.1 pilin [Clostridium butyricum E4 str. BoNT E BL5262]NFL30181.1 prepilin-type N-terminal cleavage/methylation domain-containing protein [Clostridium butyricum]NFS17717.1 prepilin-type N-terminal cleavage/methylation domain-containing protein [Clostridium butyricum]
MNQLVLKKKNELMKKKKGFTLVELIIVIAIIAVLAAVAIPKFGEVKKNSNVAADQANAKIIATAVASAIANGDESVYSASGVVDGEKIIKYIDGGKLPKVKSVNNGTWTIKYDKADGGKGVTVQIGNDYMYPVDKESDKKE